MLYVVTPTQDANERLMLEGLYIVLGQIPGPTMAAKGVGLQINRDPVSSRIVEIVVCFADRVLAADRTEAMAKVAMGEGVENVRTTDETRAFEGFGPWASV